MAEVFFANSEDPDQTPHSAASDLGLHCLPITLLGVSRIQWVKIIQVFFLFPRNKQNSNMFWFVGKTILPRARISMLIQKDTEHTVQICRSSESLPFTPDCGIHQ